MKVENSILIQKNTVGLQLRYIDWVEKTADKVVGSF